MQDDFFLNKKFVVWGMGVSGVAAYKLIKTRGYEVEAISKGDPTTWGSTVLKGDNKFYNQDSEEAKHSLKTADFIILSPEGYDVVHGIPNSSYHTGRSVTWTQRTK